MFKNKRPDKFYSKLPGLTALNKMASKNWGVASHKKNNNILMERRKNLLGTPSIAFHTP
jgi:hypothetical protein